MPLLNRKIYQKFYYLNGVYANKIEIVFEDKGCSAVPYTAYTTRTFAADIKKNLSCKFA